MFMLLLCGLFRWQSVPHLLKEMSSAKAPPSLERVQGFSTENCVTSPCFFVTSLQSWTRRSSYSQEVSGSRPVWCIDIPPHLYSVYSGPARSKPNSHLLVRPVVIGLGVVSPDRIHQHRHSNYYFNNL